MSLRLHENVFLNFVSEVNEAILFEGSNHFIGCIVCGLRQRHTGSNLRDFVREIIVRIIYH